MPCIHCISAIVFDLDVTLIDSVRDLAASTNHALAALDLPLQSEGAIKGMIGKKSKKG